MEDRISKLDKWLPQQFENTQLQWMQWIYALWQIVRSNPLTLLLLSILPFYVAQWRKRKTVVVLGESRDYYMDQTTEDYISIHPLKNVEEVKLLEEAWFTVKHRGNIYVTHGNCLNEMAECSKQFGEDIIFVERLLPVTASVAVGRKLSQTKAYEKIFSKRLHCSKGSDYVVPTCLDYGTDFNSKIWGLLSTIPILLQARSYNRLSTLLSLVIIILDCNRGWLHKVYDDLFYRFTKLVKLNVFKEKTAWYNFCSIFSSRWSYSDTVKKFAYVAQPGDRLPIRCYNKLSSVEDIDIVDWESYRADPSAKHIYMEIVKDKAYCSLKEYGEMYATAVLRSPVYVP